LRGKQEVDDVVKSYALWELPAIRDCKATRDAARRIATLYKDLFGTKPRISELEVSGDTSFEYEKTTTLEKPPIGAHFFYEIEVGPEVLSRLKGGGVVFDKTIRIESLARVIPLSSLGRYCLRGKTSCGISLTGLTGDFDGEHLTMNINPAKVFSDGLATDADDKWVFDSKIEKFLHSLPSWPQIKPLVEETIRQYML